MKRKFTLFFALVIISASLFAQVGINADGSGPDSSAMLDVKSTDRGFLPPRMTTEQMNSIVTPLEGLLVYNTSVNSLYWFNGTTWKRFNEFSFTETDPVFALHPANGISTLDIGNWNTAYANRITSANGTAPLSLAIIGNQLTGSIAQANSTANGYLTSNDWNTFNAKQNALILGSVSSTDMAITGGTNAVIGSGLNLSITKGSLSSTDLTITGGNNAVLGIGTTLTVKKGNLTEATSSVLTITGGTNAALGTGTTIQVKQATTSQSGYLSNTDWNTFNNKQNTLIFGNLTSSDITVTGGGTAVKGGGTTLAINKGNLTSYDITVTGGSGAVLGTGATLSVNKGNLTETGSSVLTISNGSSAVLGSGSTIQVKQANAGQSGYLSSTDWNSFNNKVSSQWVSSGQNISYNGGKVGIGTSAPASSAALEITSTTSGVLLPRLTYDQRNLISSPAEGLMVFCTNCGSNGALSIFSNGTWRTFIPCSSASPSAGTNALSPGQIIWNWNPVAGAVGYKWNNTSNYGSATEMNAVTTKTETGISCGATVTRYVWAYNECEISVPATLTQAVSATVPVSPVTGTHTATQVSIVWNWNTVADAIGYKWSDLDNFSTATEMGTITTKTETGLTCNTAYTRYVWAYNGCGFSTPVTLTQSTVAWCACGISTLTINHVAGPTAPVTKTTTYGTVNGIPGETAKCWITSNLGSDHQATAVSDATEASAGWYWQFNRKQGYQFISSRIPASAWITIINESFDWFTANDPCTLELGTPWRIPTYTEWYNVDITGGWTNWNGPWASGLKLHAAGNLINSAGSLDSRGSGGTYWSSKQSSSTNGWYLGFLSSGDCTMWPNNKAFGFSLRCLRDN